jgi:exopolysaccharide biosynthesis polyprenyl glycosylphosphotransferase
LGVEEQGLSLSSLEQSASHWPPADSGTGLNATTDVLAEAFVPAESWPRRRPSQGNRQLLSADVVSGSVAGALIALAGGMTVARLPVLALAFGVGWPVLAYLGGLHAAADVRLRARRHGEGARLAMVSLLASWPVFGLLTALDAAHPVTGALVGATAAGGCAGLGRAAVRAGRHRSPASRERTLIVGSGAVAQQLVDRLHCHRELGLEPVGYIDDHIHEPGELAIPRLGTLDSLADLIALGRVDRVMIAFTRSSHERLLHCIRVCRDAGVTVDIVPRLFEFLDGARTLEQIGGMPLLSIRAASMSRLSRNSKRALDILGASIAILTLAPLVAVIALAIAIDSPGPVLFTQQRSGRGGRFFRLLKLRSMRTDAAMLVRDNGAIIKRLGDERITRVGRFIRRFSLDEAPQLLNVLKGDMSLVGPRPLVVAEQEALTEGWQARRADLRPGLTGPWQVSGRSHIPFEDMIKIDYQYVAGWSLARDIEILLATLPAVLSGRGAR